MAKCKCKIRPRVISDAVKSINGNCKDVCANPICGDPDILGTFAPIIYDEIGVNLCTSFDIGTDISTTYPTASTATIRPIGATYEYGGDNVVIEALTGRPNCYRVTLANITIQFALALYDSSCRYIDTLYPTAVYLPPSTDDDTYDEDTNPTSIELDIYAPYGLSYSAADDDPAPVINYIGFTSLNNIPTQGLNLYSFAKLLDFNIDDDTVTVGLTLVLQSLYYTGYKVPTLGKINIPKGSILNPEDSACMRFVSGKLLNLEIKPLDLGKPFHEERYKHKCVEPKGCADISGCGKCGGKCTGTSDETEPVTEDAAPVPPGP